MTIDRLKALVVDDFSAVNELILDKIQSDVGLIQELSSHIIESGGKRLRPLLVLLSSRACNYQGKNHIPLAAMIEFFHTATLLHDDVIDESTLRRGRDTANSIWGSKASVLVGDYLFTLSVQLMVATGKHKILELIANTSHQISCGEIKQLANRHNETISFESYFDVIRSKTSLLFAAAASIGPIISGQDEQLEKAMYDYGLHLGNAFQLIDDALDYCSDKAVMGKNIGDDLADGKATLPLIHAFQHGTDAQKQLIKKSLQEGNRDYFTDILQAIEQTNAIVYTKEVAAKEIDRALNKLSILDDSPYKSSLIDLARFALVRDH